MRWLLLLSCVVLLASAVRGKTLLEEWNDFKIQYKKVYASDMEDRFRMMNFAEHKKNIAYHNERFAKGEFTYWLGINEYSDMSHEEFVKTMNGLDMKLASNYTNRGSKFRLPANVKVQSSIDWRDKGAVTDVKNQGLCGSCWAFSTVGTLEGQTFLKSGNLVSLSPQNLVDCATECKACNGGLPSTALEYIQQNGGIDTDQSYPYEHSQGQCRYDAQNSAATVADVVTLESTEEALMQAVGTVGPISVGIDASQENFRHYTGGVYYDDICSSINLDHAVLVVGYGSEDGKDYWIVKNSWGSTWGEMGYIRMARNRNNQCGIASNTCYPKV